VFSKGIILYFVIVASVVMSLFVAGYTDGHG
jgi:hypothetical protein